MRPHPAMGSSSLAEDDFDTLERFLQASLNPIEPSKTFRTDLHTRLRQTPVMRYTPIMVVEYFLLSILGVATAALFVLLTARMINAFLDSLGILQQMRKT